MKRYRVITGKELIMEYRFAMPNIAIEASCRSISCNTGSGFSYSKFRFFSNVNNQVFYGIMNVLTSSCEGHLIIFVVVAASKLSVKNCS